MSEPEDMQQPEREPTGPLFEETASPEIGALAEALSKAQGGFTTPKKNKHVSVQLRGGGGSYSYSYADLAAIFEAVRKPLSENGLAVIQPMVHRDGQAFLVTKVIHSSGQWIGSTIPFEIYDRPQETGSAITYARRYALSALLGIVTEEDDDAAAAQKAKGRNQRTQRAEVVEDDGSPVADNQKKRLAMLAQELGWTDEERHERAGVESFNDLTFFQAQDLTSEWQKLVNQRRKEQAQQRSSGAQPEVRRSSTPAEERSGGGSPATAGAGHPPVVDGPPPDRSKESSGAESPKEAMVGESTKASDDPPEQMAGPTPPMSPPPDEPHVPAEGAMEFTKDDAKAFPELAKLPDDLRADVVRRFGGKLRLANAAVVGVKGSRSPESIRAALLGGEAKQEAMT